MTPEARDFLITADRRGPSFLVSAMWPIVRDYMRSQHSSAVTESQRLLQLANMTKPHTWYPLAAGTQQRVIYHAGPTNSGKTYNALQVCCSVTPRLSNEAACGVSPPPCRLQQYLAEFAMI